MTEIKITCKFKNVKDDLRLLNLNEDDEIEIILRPTGRQWNEYSKK